MFDNWSNLIIWSTLDVCFIAKDQQGPFNNNIIILKKYYIIIIIRKDNHKDHLKMMSWLHHANNV